MRRSAMVGSVLVAVLVAGGAGAALVVGRDDAGRTRSTLRTSYADATPVRAGDDHRVLRRLPAAAATRVDLMLPDGQLVLLGGTDVAFLDPATGERREVRGVKARQRDARVVVLDDGDLFFAWQFPVEGAGRGEPDTRIGGYRVDPSTGTKERLLGPVTVPRGDFPEPIGTVRHLAPGADDRLWFVTGRVGYGDGDSYVDERTLELWSSSLDDPSDARREAPRVDDLAMAGDHVVWTEPSGFVTEDDGFRLATALTVHSRDLRDGSEQQVELDDCRGGTFGDVAPVSATLVPVDCGTGDGYLDLVVLDPAMTVLARISTRLPSFGEVGAGVGERFVVRGSVAYDAALNRVLRLTTRRGWEGPRESVPARVATAGDRILFPDGDEPSARRGTWALADFSR